MASVAYRYAEEPGPVAEPPSVLQRLPVAKDQNGRWRRDPGCESPGPLVQPTKQMQELLRRAEEG